MRYATPLRPQPPGERSSAEIVRCLREREQWLDQLGPAQQFHRLFDHIPGLFFFAKDRAGRVMYASNGLLQRYKMDDERGLVGLTDYDVNPGSMAESFVGDDQRILTGKAAVVEHVELWWDREGMPDWFLVTKLPIVGKAGRIEGVMGVLRRPDMAESQLPVYATLATAVDQIRRDYGSPLRIADVARRCGQSPRQLQRHFQAAFGTTPQDFLMKTRVVAAAKLLETTPLTVQEIAVLCGFLDQSAFTLHFRKRTGLAPSAYRQRPRST